MRTSERGPNLWVSDPDANGVELMWDRPLEASLRDEEGHLLGGEDDDLDLDALLAELKS